MTTVALARGVLTDEHAQSSYGQPVLVVDGVAHGPGDMVDMSILGPESAYKQGLANAGPLTDEELALIEKWRRMGEILGLA